MRLSPTDITTARRLCSLLRCFRVDPQVQSAALWAIARIGDPFIGGGAAVLLQAGACEDVCEAMCVHTSSPAVLGHACWALAVLSPAMTAGMAARALPLVEGALVRFPADRCVRERAMEALQSLMPVIAV